MNLPNTNAVSAPHGPDHAIQAAIRRCWLCALALTVCFSYPLFELVRFALNNDLYSHIVLVPLVSAYLIWTRPSASIGSNFQPDRKVALGFLIAGAVVLAIALSVTRTDPGLSPEDHLAGRILPYLLFLGGACAWFLDPTTLRTVAFPLAFLLFMVPFPTAVLAGLETLLQHGSAQTAYVLFKLSGTTVFYDDLIFRLRGINLQVAPECSGIHSSLALFITSVLAGYFCLRTPWKCAVLTLAVIPLAIMRNGFRIFTIGELCVHVSPDMINSYIHRRGGPIFFILSLIPFFFLLRVLVRSEPARISSKSTAPAP